MPLVVVRHGEVERAGLGAVERPGMRWPGGSSVRAPLREVRSNSRSRCRVCAPMRLHRADAAQWPSGGDPVGPRLRSPGSGDHPLGHPAGRDRWRLVGQTVGPLGRRRSWRQTRSCRNPCAASRPLQTDAVGRAQDDADSWAHEPTRTQRVQRESPARDSNRLGPLAALVARAEAAPGNRAGAGPGRAGLRVGVPGAPVRARADDGSAHNPVRLQRERPRPEWMIIPWRVPPWSCPEGPVFGTCPTIRRPPSAGRGALVPEGARGAHSCRKARAGARRRRRQPGTLDASEHGGTLWPAPSPDTNLKLQPRPSSYAPPPAFPAIRSSIVRRASARSILPVPPMGSWSTTKTRRGCA